MAVHEDEQILIDRCLGGDQRAWSEFVERYTDLVYSSIHHSLRARGARMGSDEVEDLHNGIFLAFIERDGRKLRQFDGRCRLTSWIKVVSVNYTIDRLRRRRRVVSLDDSSGDGPGLIALLESDERVASESLETRQDLKLVAVVVAKLSKSERELVDLLFVQERPFPEIAERLGTSLGAVYTRKNRLIAKIKDRFDKELKKVRANAGEKSRGRASGDGKA